MTGPELYLLFAVVTIGSASGLVQLRELLRGDVVGAALRTERERAIAELLALAILADGEISPEERAAVENASATASAQEKAALATLMASAVDLRSPEVLRQRIRSAAAALDPDDRVAVFAMVKNLAHRGSRAWGEEESYRSAGPSPEALVAIFRDALVITAAG